MARGLLLNIQAHGTQWNVPRRAGHPLISLEGHEDWEMLLRTREKEVSFCLPQRQERSRELQTSYCFIPGKVMVIVLETISKQ